MWRIWIDNIQFKPVFETVVDAKRFAMGIIYGVAFDQWQIVNESHYKHVGMMLSIIKQSES